MNIIRVLSLLFESKADAAKSAVSRLVIFLILFSVACLVAVLGVAFLLWSSYLYFSTILSPAQAALITGGGAILIGVIIVLIAYLLTNTSGGKAKTEDKFKDLLNSDDLGFASEFINDHPLESGLSAAVLGFIAGSSPDVRQTLTQLLIDLRQSQRMN